MKRFLALDTSTWWGGVALVERATSAAAPEVVAELGLRVPRSHAPGLLQRVDRLLAEAGWSKKLLDGYVAVRGPGSFTGVRVALGVVQGLGLATGRPCYGVNGLEAIAEAHGPADRDRVPLIGAGRGEVYGARFDAASSPPRELVAPWLGPAEKVLGEAEGGAVVLCAPGSQEPVAELDLDPARHRCAPAPRSVAAAAGRLALIGRGAESDPARPLSPLYLRPPDAEIKSRPSRR